MYAEEFPIVDGSITAALIDEEYCLSYVMPNCRIRLSTLSGRQRAVHEGLGDYAMCTVPEDPPGTFLGLQVDTSYHVFIEQEEAQLKRDQERMRAAALQMEGAADPNAPAPLTRADGHVMESCSCIYGNPCMDEYGCKDWNSRFAVALKNGWKGF